MIGSLYWLFDRVFAVESNRETRFESVVN